MANRPRMSLRSIRATLAGNIGAQPVSRMRCSASVSEALKRVRVTIPGLQRTTTQSSVRRLRKLICVAALRPGHAPSRCFAANSVPGRRAARCDLLALGHGEQAFALRQFPRRFARAPDRFRLLAGLALRRFFIRLAALHLTKDAFALQLLFEHLESLIDVVVAYEYLQNVSDLPSSAARAVKLLMKVSRSARLEILRRLLAAVADHFILEHLTFVERGQAGALDRGDVDEYVFAAVLRRNEPITFRRVEPFHRASSHSWPPLSARI